MEASVSSASPFPPSLPASPESSLSSVSTSDEVRTEVGFELETGAAVSVESVDDAGMSDDAEFGYEGERVVERRAEIGEAG